MYVRQLAWLRAVPDGSKISRYEELQAIGGEFNLPPLNGAEYLITLLDQAGTCSSNGFGLIGLSWGEIKDWMDCMSIDLPYWDISMLKEMSREYAAQANKSTEKSCKSPYLADTEIKTEKAIIARSNEIANIFRKFKNIKPSNEGSEEL